MNNRDARPSSADSVHYQFRRSTTEIDFVEVCWANCVWHRALNFTLVELTIEASSLTAGRRLFVTQMISRMVVRRNSNKILWVPDNRLSYTIIKVETSSMEIKSWLTHEKSAVENAVQRVAAHPRCHSSAQLIIWLQSVDSLPERAQPVHPITRPTLVIMYVALCFGLIALRANCCTLHQVSWFHFLMIASTIFNSRYNYLPYK